MKREAAAPLLEQLPEEERFKTWWLAERDGRLRSHTDGGVALLGHMHMTRPLARRLQRPRIEGALARLDNLVAHHKSRLGKVVPNGPGPYRYP